MVSCTLLYAKKPDEMKKGISGMIIYNNRNTYSFRDHFITAYKRIFHNFFLAWMVDLILCLVMMSPPLMEVWIPLYRVRKFQMTIPLSLVQWHIVFQGKKLCS